MSDEDDSRDQHRRKMMAFVASGDTPDVDGRNLGNALYTMGELGLFADDVDSVSTEQAIRIYKLISAVMLNGFPNDLKM
jgi:hypothetical protein